MGTVDIEGKDSQDALFIFFVLSLINRKKLRNILTEIQYCTYNNTKYKATV